MGRLIMKGKNFLKVTGILMIIGGAFGIIGGIISIVGVAALAAVLETSAGGLMFASILVLISAIIELIAGISGVKNCARAEKAQSCLIMGILVALLCIAGNITSIVLGSSVAWYSWIVGLVLPVLYIIGAVLNKKAA